MYFTVKFKHITNILRKTIGVEKVNNIFINAIKVPLLQQMVIKKVLEYNFQAIKTMTYE